MKTNKWFKVVGLIILLCLMGYALNMMVMFAWLTAAPSDYELSDLKNKFYLWSGVFVFALVSCCWLGYKLYQSRTKKAE